MVISYPLWLTDRPFPVVRLFEWAPIIPNPFDYLLIGLFTIGAILLFLKPTTVRLWGVILPLLILVLTDQMRWQPWIYQYLWMFLVMGIYMRSHRRSDAVLNTLRLMMVCIYLYSGLSKINPYFIEYGINSFFPWIYYIIPSFLHSYLPYLSIGIILAEIALAIGLLFRSKRRMVVYLLMGMHFAIILFIVILNRWNPVIIPWNVVMIGLLFMLFIRNESFSRTDILWNHGKYTHLAIILFFLLLPAFSVAGLWPKYLSFHLYSYTTDNVIIEFEPNAELPENTLWTSQVAFTDSTATLNVFMWSMEKLYVTHYPESNTYKTIIQLVCANSEEQITGIYRGVVYFEKEKDEKKLCSDYW